MIAIDGVPERLELARRFGATETVSLADFPESADRVARVQELTGGVGADMVLEVTGVPASFVEAVELARVGGRIASVGNLNAEADVMMTPGIVTRKSVHIHGVLRYHPWYLHKAIAFLARRQHLHPFEAFSDRSFPLDDVTEALKAGESRSVAPGRHRPLSRTTTRPQTGAHRGLPDPALHRRRVEGCLRRRHLRRGRPRDRRGDRPGRRRDARTTSAP